VDRSRLGDTLEVFGGLLGQEVTLGALDTTIVTVGFTYPKVALAAVDTVPVGRLIFVEGIALNAIGATGTRDLHLRSGADALRATNVVRRAVSLGDSVRLLGRRGRPGAHRAHDPASLHRPRQRGRGRPRAGAQRRPAASPQRPERRHPDRR
jgi:hypothetical protein